MLKMTLMFTLPVSQNLRYQQMVVTYIDDAEKTTTVPIEDVGVVVIENQQVRITVPLLNYLAQNSVQVVFCGNNGMPCSTLLSFEGNNISGIVARMKV